MFVQLPATKVSDGIYRVAIPLPVGVEKSRFESPALGEKIAGYIRWIREKIATVYGQNPFEVGVFQPPTIDSSGALGPPSQENAGRIFFGESFENAFFAQGATMPAWFAQDSIAWFGPSDQPNTVTHIGFYLVSDGRMGDMGSFGETTLQVSDDPYNIETQVVQAPPSSQEMEGFAEALTVGVVAIIMGIIIKGIFGFILLALGIAIVAYMLIRPVVAWFQNPQNRARLAKQADKVLNAAGRLLKTAGEAAGNFAVNVMLGGLIGFGVYKLFIEEKPKKAKR